MSKTTSLVEETVLGYLQDATNGMNATMAAIEERDSVVLDRVDANSWIQQDVPLPLLIEAVDIVFPHVLVYVPTTQNSQTEKFRYFAGFHECAVEIRASVDDFNGLVVLKATLNRLVEAALNTLQSTGFLSAAQAAGIQYGRKFDVRYGPVESGGDNFVQSAVIRLQIEQRVGT